MGEVGDVGLVVVAPEDGKRAAMAVPMGTDVPSLAMRDSGASILVTGPS